MQNVFQSKRSKEPLKGRKFRGQKVSRFREFFGHSRKFIPAKSYFDGSSRNIARKITKNGVKIRKIHQKSEGSRKFIPAKLNFRLWRSRKFIPDQPGHKTIRQGHAYVLQQDQCAHRSLASSGINHRPSDVMSIRLTSKRSIACLQPYKF